MRPAKILLCVPLLALLLSGCSMDWDHNGVRPGMSQEEVQALLPDLRPADAVLRKKPAAVPDKPYVTMLWRFPAAANGAAFEAYGFRDGSLELLMVGYGGGVKVDDLAERVEARNGLPSDRASVAGGEVVHWEQSGGELTIMRMPGASDVKYVDANGKEASVSCATMLIYIQRRSLGMPLYAIALVLLAAACASVAWMRMELERTARSAPALRTRADLDAFRRLGFRHKCMDLAASLLLICAGVCAAAGMLRDEWGLLDLLVVLGLFSLYTWLGKKYQAFGRGLSRHPVENEELRSDWEAWLKVMNTPLALGDAQRHSQAAR